MIRSPTHHDVEVRLLRAIMTRPGLLSIIPDLEVADFNSLVHRKLWETIRNVEWANTPDPVATSDQLKALCSATLAIEYDGHPGSSGMILSDEIAGLVELRLMNPLVIRPDGQNEDRARKQVSEDAALLKLARRSRERSEARQIAAAERRK